MKHWKPFISLSLCFLLSARPASGDDTDLFMAIPPGSSVPGVNVLIILDNSSNWSHTYASGTSFFDAEVAALNSVISGLTSSINVGLMMFAESGSNGGYVRYAVRPMNATNKVAFQSMMSTMIASGSGNDNSASNQPYGKALFEAYKYFGGYTSPAHATDNVAGTPADSQHFGSAAFAGIATRRDFTGNVLPTTGGGLSTAEKNRNAALNAVYALSGNAFSGQGVENYTSPITNACQRNFVIFISNGNPATGGDSGNPNAQTLLQNVGGNVNSVNPPNHASLADEYARFLHLTDVGALAGQQNVTTYTISVYNPSSMIGSDADMIRLMQSMANQGHGKYFAATDAATLLSSLQTAFNEMSAVNDVFASVVLPVNVNVRGTSLNQVYMGVFRPDANALPRWYGNLKEYQLIASGNTVFLGDANAARADNPSTGFITDAATSYWTASSNFWNFSPSGTPASGSDAPDGAVVEKGGAAQRLRTVYSTAQSTRNLYTCLCGGAVCSGTQTCSGGPLTTPFSSTTISAASAANQALFGATSTTYSNANTGNTGKAGELADIINWVRGADNAADENLSSSFADIRASVHGDVVHSRPAVISYNSNGSCATADTQSIYIFYGSNDGIFHAIKGGQQSSDGYELWGFVPPEFYGRYKRLRDNTPAISLNTLPPASTANNKPYLADGAFSVYQFDGNNDCKYTSGGSDKVFLFASARRGGRFMYAFDVTNPASPSLKWEIANTLADFSELGYTWSNPAVSVVNLSGTRTPVVIFGGGYDPSVEDLDPQYITSNIAASVTTSAGGGTTVSRSMGRRIYVVNADTGALVWSAGPSAGPLGVPASTVSGMDYAMPGDALVIDVNDDGYDDRAYIGDTGGNVWRINIADPDPNNWQVTHFAALASGSAARRKFLFQPSAVAGSDLNGAYHAVLIGSGDREHPFETTVTNRFYMLKDRATGFSSTQATPIVESNLFDATSVCNQASACTNARSNTYGWYVTLLNGEKTVGSSTVMNNVVFFNTNRPTTPDAGVCTGNLGEARSYAVNYLDATFPQNGTSRFQIVPGGGFPPSPVAAVVYLPIPGGGTAPYQIVISGTTISEVPGVQLGNRTRVWWFEEIE